MVREVLAGHMEERGYRVARAGDGLEALAQLDGGAAVDLLISDFAMPGMDGLTLIQEARRRRPELPALLLTGYADAGVRSPSRLPARGARRCSASRCRAPRWPSARRRCWRMLPRHAAEKVAALRPKARTGGRSRLIRARISHPPWA
jgi:CheY-like chemotaxis protein